MDLLDRLHRRLVRAALDGAGGSGGGDRTTIAGIYQRLIPYRLVRGDLGVMELAEYEHALLRLLAGERGYLEVRDPSALAEIQRELASISPILGIYRDYPNVEVRIVRADGSGADRLAVRGGEGITPAGTETLLHAGNLDAGDGEADARAVETRAPADGGEPTPGPAIPASDRGGSGAVDLAGPGWGGAGPPSTSTGGTSGGSAPAAAYPPVEQARPGTRTLPAESAAGPRVAGPTGARPTGRAARIAAAGPDPRADERSGRPPPTRPGTATAANRDDGPLARVPVISCVECAAALPHIAGLNFCPFCGTRQGPVACASCGSEIRPEWRFCVTCGRERAAAAGGDS